jgi:membrane-associated protease RseP (regulator of RpoE activity)
MFPEQPRKSSRRVLASVSVIAALLLGMILVMLISSRNSPKQQDTLRIGETAREFVGDPAHFISNRFTGPIGVALTIHSSGFPSVVTVLKETPAESSGLNPGDLIVEINGKTTTGMALTEVVETMRGFTLSDVVLGIQRNETNLSLRIGRISWQKLQEKGLFR